MGKPLFYFLIYSLSEKEEIILLAAETKAAEATEQKPDGASETVTDALKRIAEELHLTEAELTKTVEIFEKYKTMQSINSNLMKLFKDGEKVKRKTKVIKPFIRKRNSAFDILSVVF